MMRCVNVIFYNCVNRHFYSIARIAEAGLDGGRTSCV